MTLRGYEITFCPQCHGFNRPKADFIRQAQALMDEIVQVKGHALLFSHLYRTETLKGMNKETLFDLIQLLRMVVLGFNG